MGFDLCPECGDAPAEGHQPGRWERFRHWLVNGGEAPTTLVCPNGQEWGRGVGQIARVGSHWAAFMAGGDVLVELRGNMVDADQIQLVRIASLDHYTRRGA